MAPRLASVKVATNPKIPLHKLSLWFCLHQSNDRDYLHSCRQVYG